MQCFQYQNGQVRLQVSLAYQKPIISNGVAMHCVVIRQGKIEMRYLSTPFF